MKRKYIVISSFFVALVLLGIFCYAVSSYAGRVSGKRAGLLFQNVLVSHEVANANEKITSDTNYVVEVYNEDSEELVREERTMPAELAGMTREEVEEYLKQYKTEMQENDAEEGLESIQLVSFSRDELVIRKSYVEPEATSKQEGYSLRFTRNGEVGIYSRDGKTLYEETGITRDKLPEEEAEKLMDGYVVESQKELYSILENFSS